MEETKEVLTTYLHRSDRNLNRLIRYAERFTLKGGIFLYALFDGEYARATMDIDLLAQRTPNDADITIIPLSRHGVENQKAGCKYIKLVIGIV